MFVGSFLGGGGPFLVNLLLRPMSNHVCTLLAQRSPLIIHLQEAFSMIQLE